MSGNTPTNLPQYIKGDIGEFETYLELLSLILTTWFNSDGFFLPALTATQVTALLALNPLPTQIQWINSTTNKIQFIDTSGTLQTVTST